MGCPLHLTFHQCISFSTATRLSVLRQWHPVSDGMAERVGLLSWIDIVLVCWVAQLYGVTVLIHFLHYSLALLSFDNNPPTN